MSYLVFASLIWAFSFGMIKKYLSGLDPLYIATVRLGFSSLLFLPFFLRHCFKVDRVGVKIQQWAMLSFSGLLEFGIMYVLYFKSYHFLAAWQVALYTVTTPVFIWLIHDYFHKKLNYRRVLPVTLALLGAGWMFFKTAESQVSNLGFVLVQGSNICFALGQIMYRNQKIKMNSGIPEESLFFVQYFSAFCMILCLSVFNLSWTDQFQKTFGQASTGLALVYSGLVASGLGFFLWNKGVVRSTPSLLSVLNNLKAPLAMAAAFLVFNEKVELIKLTGALVLLLAGIGSAYWAERKQLEKK